MADPLVHSVCLADGLFRPLILPPFMEWVRENVCAEALCVTQPLYFRSN